MDTTYTSTASQRTAVGHDESGTLQNGHSISASHTGPPKGAMPARLPSNIAAVPYNPSQSPAASPSPAQVQFASYRSDFAEEKTAPKVIPVDQDEKKRVGWTPMPLKTWFWVSFILTMIVLAIGLEIALYYNKKSNGWNPVKVSTSRSVMHYVYTLPPVIIAGLFAALWAWTDIEVKKMQPYVDLVHGDSPPERSLLLDYTRHNNFVVWTRAAHNKHYLVALTSLMTILVISFSPLAAALLSTRPTWWSEADTPVSNSATLGLFESPQASDLTAYVTASGYASASVLYDLYEAPFVYKAYTVAPFEMPYSVARNGTVYAATTAVKSEPNCKRADTIRTQIPELSRGWNVSAIFEGCTYNWTLSDELNRHSINLFGSDLFDCGSTEKLENQPVVFWFFTYNPSIESSATVCKPTVSFWEVNVEVDIASGNITSLTELRPFNQQDSPLSSTSGTLDVLNGKAQNGVGFTLDQPDRFILERINATRLQLPASVFQRASQNDGGFAQAFQTESFTKLSNEIYTIYLKIIARSIYFIPTSSTTASSDQNITLKIRTVRERLFLNDVAVHLLAAAMFILALFGTIIHLFHRLDRFDLNLTHAPGTIASAVSIGGDTGMGELLAHSRKEEDIAQALKDRKFRIDPVTMKIIMQGEEAYESATSPDPRRSVFGTLKSRPSSRRYSKAPPGISTAVPVQESQV